MFAFYDYFSCLWLLCLQFMIILVVYGYSFSSLWLLCLQFVVIMFAVYGYSFSSLWLFL